MDFSVMLLPADGLTDVYRGWRPREDVLNPFLEVLCAHAFSSYCIRFTFLNICLNPRLPNFKHYLTHQPYRLEVIGIMIKHSLAWYAWRHPGILKAVGLQKSEFPSKMCIIPCDSFNTHHCSTGCCASDIPASLFLSLFLCGVNVAFSLVTF